MNSQPSESDSYSLSNSLRYITVFKLYKFQSLLLKQSSMAFANLCECDASLTTVLNSTFSFKRETFLISDQVEASISPDTITFISKGNTNNDCIAMLTAATLFLSHCVSKHILISGVTSYGHFYVNQSGSLVCGKPYATSSNLVNSINMNALVCDKIVYENLEEVRMFTSDSTLFTKFGRSLIDSWSVPLAGYRLKGGIVKKNMFILNWPCFSMDLFETLKSYSLTEFYAPYESVYGVFDTLDDKTKLFFESSLDYMNHSLSQTVASLNSSL